MTWKDGWPVIGENGKLPASLTRPAVQSVAGVRGIMERDDFERHPGERPLPLAWQWNYNPMDRHWSLTDRPGFLRLMTGRVVDGLLSAPNTLTQRTFGPQSTATIAIDVSNIKDGDVAGLTVLQRQFGLIGVKQVGQTRAIVMQSAANDRPEELASVPLEQSTRLLLVHCDFRNRADVATFAYSLNGERWEEIGRPLAMAYTLPHFLGYRFGLFDYVRRSRRAAGSTSTITE